MDETCTATSITKFHTGHEFERHALNAALHTVHVPTFFIIRLPIWIFDTKLRLRRCHLKNSRQMEWIRRLAVVTPASRGAFKMLDWTQQ